MTYAETIKNEFVVYRAGDEFMLNRHIVESVTAKDLLALREQLENRIKVMTDELDSLKKQKEKFDKHVSIAEEIIKKNEKEFTEGIKTLKYKEII